MNRLSTLPQQLNLSYELYKELAGEICASIDDLEMTLQLKFELYQSKLIYLYNISNQCFRSMNSKNEQDRLGYTQADLIHILNAIEVTKGFLKQTVKDSLISSIKLAEKKAFHVSRFQKPR